jgi:hypothetical protein
LSPIRGGGGILFFLLFLDQNEEFVVEEMDDLMGVVSCGCGGGCGREEVVSDRDRVKLKKPLPRALVGGVVVEEEAGADGGGVEAIEAFPDDMELYVPDLLAAAAVALAMMSAMMSISETPSTKGVDGRGCTSSIESCGAAAGRGEVGRDVDCNDVEEEGVVCCGAVSVVGANDFEGS